MPRALCALAMTHAKKFGGRADVGIGPYGMVCRGGRLCPPGVVRLHTMRRGGALLPTVVPTD